MKGEKFPERNARIRALRALGLSSLEIARQLNLPLSAVAGVFFRDDHPWHRPSRKHPRPEDIDAINLRFGGRA